MKSKPPIQSGLLVIILLLAIYLRLGYLVEIISILPDENIFCGGDAFAYDARAQAALIGDWPGDSHFTQVPLYSFYLASVYRFFGVNYLVPLILQMLLDVVACAAIYWIGKFVFSPLTGLLTALAVALYGPLISYQVCYAQAPLTTPLLVLSFFFLFRFYSSKWRPYLFASGVMVGLSVLSRPTLIVLLPVWLLWFFSERKSLNQFAKNSVWLFGAVGLVVLPLTVHNYRITGRLIPITDQGSVNFYFGNNPYSSGIGPHDVISQYGERQGDGFVFTGEFREVSDKVEAGELTYLGQTYRYISEYPQDWAELIAKKAYLMFLEPDWKLILFSFAYPSSSVALKTSHYLQVFPTEWAALIITSLLTLIFVRNRYVYFFWLTILAMSLGIIVFFVKFRFRLPLTPILLLLSMALVANGRHWFQHDRHRFVVVLLLLLALFPLEPGLLIFIVQYLAVALFPNRRNRGRLNRPVWRFRWPILAGWSYIVVVAFGLQVFEMRESNAQIKNHFVGPEVWGPLILGQTFTPDCNGLYQIEVELSRAGFGHKQPYYFHLVRNLNLNDEVYAIQFEVDEASRWIRKRFTFPPQTTSQGQSYFFYLQSPNTQPGNSLAVRMNPDWPTVYDRYEQGTIYAGNTGNLHPYPADFVFSAYCQESWNQLFARTIRYMATSGPGIFAFPEVYYAIFFLHVTLFIVALSIVGRNTIKR